MGLTVELLPSGDRMPAAGLAQSFSFGLILVNVACSLGMRRLLHDTEKREPGMYKKIIVPVAMDQMERGEQILGRAVGLLSEGGEVVLVNVIEIATSYISIEFPAGMVEMEVKQAEERLARMRDRLGLKATIDIRYGASAREILAAAQEHGADLIVVASHRPGLANYLLGSTADRVVRHAPISVLVDR